MSEKAEIEVFQVDADWHPYPWRFAVTYKGVRHTFAGLPNLCETRRSATMRARWRAKWLEEGSFTHKYA
jgi:hypothetical protein